MKKILLIAMILSCGIAFGQTTIAVQDFEDTPATPTMTYTNTGGTVSAGEALFPSDFEHYSEGLKGIIVSNGTMVIESDAIDVSAFTGISVSFRLASLAGTSGNGADGSDGVLVEISTDNGSTYSEELEVNGNSNARWGFTSGTGEASTAYDGDNSATNIAPSSGGNLTTDGYSTVTVTDVTASSELKIKITANNNSGNETWAIDNIQVTGISASSETVGFDAASSSETETDGSFAVSIPVTLSNYGGSQVDLSVSVSGGTAEMGDYTLNTSSLSFTSSATQNVSIDINNDADIIDETIIITIAETSSTGITISPSTHTITVTDDEAPSLIVNEYQADPDASNGDANNDGVSNTSDDEFVEIVNTGLSSVDLSNWILADAASDRHTFPSGTVLAPNQAIVVFGGGAPSGSFGGALVQTASSGKIELNNGGDDIILKTDNEDEILNVNYGSSSTNQSYTLDADLVGSFTQHSSATGSGGALFSPGTKIDGSTFAATASITWDGSESTDWDNPDNWDGGVIPSSNDNVTIADVANDPILSSGDHAAVNNLTVNSGAVLSVDSGGSLAIFGTVTNNGTCYFEKALGDNGYSIIGSPVSGETIDALGTDHFYSNTNGSGFSSNLKNSTSVMTPGQGYFAAYDGASQFPVFEGTPNSGDVTYTPVASSGFELIANPYAAAISTTKFLSDNTSVITGGVYFWDDGGSNVGADRGGDYITVTAMGAASAVQPSGSDDGVTGNKGDSRAENGYIPSGQGVFVEVTSTSDITFSQSHQVIVPGSNDDSNYYREGGYQKVKLAISGNGLYNEVLVGLGEEATYDVDRLLDAKKFSSGSALSFYSMIEDEKYVIQGLPLASFENVNAQLGFDLAEEGTFTMNVVDLENIPENINVTVIDHLTGISHDLKTIEEFEFNSAIVENDQRFELQFSPVEVLSTDKLSDELSVSGNASELQIQAQLNGDHQLTIYSLDGKIAIDELVTFKNNKVTIQHKLSLNNVYIMQLGEESFKFVIQ